MKIDVRAFKGPQERTLAPNDHQSGAPRPKNASKIVSKTNKNQYFWKQIHPKPILDYFELWLQMCFKNVMFWISSKIPTLQIFQIL